MVRGHAIRIFSLDKPSPKCYIQNRGHMKAYPKTERRVVTVTIDESGDMVYLNTSESDIFMELGERITRRASHVVPSPFWSRLLFKAIRYFVHDDSASAEWCRTWRGPWMVDTTPTAGVVLEGRWMNRQDAIDAEITFLNSWFLERGN
jgi:hypothetical protein